MAYGNENHLLITWLMMVDHWWQWIIMGYLTGDLTGYREFYWVLKWQLTRNYRTSSCLKCKKHQKRVFYILWRVKWGWCLGSEVIFLHPAYSWVDIPMFSGGPYSWSMCAHQILDLCLATQSIRPHHFWVRSTLGWTLHANFSWETFFSSLPPILVYIYIISFFGKSWMLVCLTNIQTKALICPFWPCCLPTSRPRSLATQLAEWQKQNPQMVLEPSWVPLVKWSNF